MKDFDTSQDSKIDMQEFIAGVGRWLQVAKGNNVNSRSGSMKYIDDYHTVIIIMYSAFPNYFTIL